VRLRKTFAGTPLTRQTSAGHAAWQTGQRLVVRLSSSSVKLREFAIIKALGNKSRYSRGMHILQKKVETKW